VDLKKAFEHVDHSLLAKTALAFGYPLSTLRASLLAYAGPRRLTFLGYVSAPLWPTRGIAAGSTTATHELWLLLCEHSRTVILRPRCPFMLMTFPQPQRPQMRPRVQRMLHDWLMTSSTNLKPIVAWPRPGQRLRHRFCPLHCCGHS
jgi:hypothetical protein